MSYKVKPTKVQLQKLKLCWAIMRKEERIFFDKVREIEKNMQEDVGIKDVEFFWDDGYVGIGNTSRTMKLISGFDLEARRILIGGNDAKS